MKKSAVNEKETNNSNTSTGGKQIIKGLPEELGDPECQNKTKKFEGKLRTMFHI